MYFNVNFNVLFKLIKVPLLVCELYIYIYKQYFIGFVNLMIYMTLAK